MKFIYVFNEEDKNMLLSQGMTLLKSDATHGVFIFENDEDKTDLVFSELGNHVFSNTLTF